MCAEFQKWCLIPGTLVGLMLAFKRRVPQLVPKHLAFPIMVLPEHA
jgi:hypothetical protein